MAVQPTKRPGDTYSRQEAFDLAMKIVNDTTTPYVFVDWDDLPDVNSMWDFIDDGMTFKQIKEAAKEAYEQRLRDDDADDDLIDLIMND